MNERREFEKLSLLFPTHSDNIDWGSLEKTILSSLLLKMKDTPQNPEYHAEGDVLTHTKMVCEALVKLPEYRASNEKDKEILFLAALLHDIGKARCTVIENGKIRSPHHAAVGANMARELFFRELGLSGDYESCQLREAVCTLIRYHSFPPYAVSDKIPEYKMLKIAAQGELATGFSISKLCMLEKADVLGRACSDGAETLEKIELCRMLSEEIGCDNAPYPFADDFSKRAYFRKKTNWRDQSLYNDSWGEVIMMSGLPGTGKDTWIAKNCPDLPMISLDEIRAELKILPTDNQGRVIALAHERAREYLRRRQPFVWNATSITSQIRAMQISLFEEYGASVKTVFLETSWNEELRRNSERKREVPEAAIERMLSKLEPPERHESENVVWESV